MKRISFGEVIAAFLGLVVGLTLVYFVGDALVNALWSFT